MEFKAGRYFVGDLKRILDYESFHELKFGFGKLSNGYEYANFDVGPCDGALKGSDGFKFFTDSGSIGVIDSKIINEDLLCERILGIHQDLLYDKTTSFIFAKMLNIQTNFAIAFRENSIFINNYIIKIK